MKVLRVRITACRSSHVTGLVVAAAVLLGFSAPARAQFGFGFGMGFGGYHIPSPTSMINERSNIAATAAYAARGGPGGRGFAPLANNPNSSVNLGRQIRFQQQASGAEPRFNVSSRRPLPEATISPRDNPYALAANPSVTPATNVAMAIALPQFFNAAGMLVWPDSAPTQGVYEAKRAAADQASMSVFNQWNTDGLARVSTVTEARSNLIEYGRPALDYLRSNTTTAVADGFHRFLLGLYEALEQAANIPNPKVKRP